MFEIHVTFIRTKIIVLTDEAGSLDGARVLATGPVFSGKNSQLETQFASFTLCWSSEL